MINKFNQELPPKVPLLKRMQELQDPIISDKTAARGLRNSVAPGRLLTSTDIFQVYDLHRNGRLDEIRDEMFSKQYLEALRELCSGFISPNDLMKKYFDKNEPSAKTGYVGLTESP